MKENKWMDIIAGLMVFIVAFIGYIIGLNQNKKPTCEAPQDIIQQCDDLRMSLDNLSESCFRE